MPIAKRLVRETYRKFYREIRVSTEAWNRTLETLVPKIGPARRQVSALLMDVVKQVELEEGDPYRMAVKTAMDSLRTQDAVKRGREAYEDFYQAIVEAVRRAAGFLKSKEKKQDWSPRNIPMQGETPPRSIEEALERSDPPSLFITFSEDGQLRGVSVDYPDSFRGWGAATAVIPVSADLSDAQIEDAVEEALGELEIWDQELDQP